MNEDRTPAPGVNAIDFYRDEIDRLRAENERLRASSEEECCTYPQCMAEIDRLRAEIERLNKVIGAYQIHPKHRMSKEGE